MVGGSRGPGRHPRRDLGRRGADRSRPAWSSRSGCGRRGRRRSSPAVRGRADVDACPARRADDRPLPGMPPAAKIGAPHTPAPDPTRPRGVSRMEAFRSARPDLDDILDLDVFEAGLHGSIVLPGSPDYDEARQVQMAQSSTAVPHSSSAPPMRPTWRARSSWRASPGSPLSVRGGGHSLAGYGMNDGGIVLDLRAMKGLHIDHGAAARMGAARSDGVRVHVRRCGPWPCDAVRRHRLGRDLRADARWRHRLARAQIRSRHRRPRGGRDRYRRRPPAHGQRRLAPRPLLGGPRRRWQLRCRHPVPVPPLSRRRGPRRRPVHARRRATSCAASCRSRRARPRS